MRLHIAAFTYAEGEVCDEVESLILNAQMPAESRVSFAQDANGKVYVINMARGSILRIDPQ